MTTSIANSGLFRSPFANWTYIWIIPCIAIATGLSVYLKPDWFLLILTLDLWLLGYHHVIATYTRIGFDRTSAKEHWKLLLPLPALVLGLVVLGYYLFGGVLIASIYLYWQWYHYTRQSEGIAKAYGMKQGDRTTITSSTNRGFFYGISLLSFMWMITRQDSHFLGMQFWSFSLPEPVRHWILVVLFVATAYWLIKLARLTLNKAVSPFYFSYMASHVLIYIFSYVIIEPVSYGWLIINIWHNAQYIFFVWLFNNKKFAVGEHPKQQALAYLSQSKNWPIYLLACLAISGVVYTALEWFSIEMLIKTGLPSILLIYATINFHHYVVDSRIWKLRKPQMQSQLELNNA